MAGVCRKVPDQGRDRRTRIEAAPRMINSTLHHIVRIRTSDDLTYMRPGLMDEVMVNANLLEHRPDSTASALRATTLPYCIDPVLTRFQVPEWWKNEKGATQRNY